MTVRQALIEILTKENKSFSTNTTKWKNETIHNKEQALITRLKILFPNFVSYNISRPVPSFESFMEKFDTVLVPDPVKQDDHNNIEKVSSAEEENMLSEEVPNSDADLSIVLKSAQYENELRSILAMFWFAYMKYCMEGHTDDEDDITEVLKDVKTILGKASQQDGKFKDYQERSRRITHFFEKNKNISEIMCLYEYFRTTDDIYSPPDILGIESKDAIHTINTHSQIKVIKGQVDTIIEKYETLIDKCRVDEFDQAYFPDIVECPSLDYELTDDEVKLIGLMFAIFPDDELFDKLRADHWELLSKDHWKELISCISDLRENPAIFGRYLRALHTADYESKADEIEGKLTYPYQYRIARKAQQIQHHVEYVCSEIKDPFKLSLFEQHLDTLLVAIQPTEKLTKNISVEKQIERAVKEILEQQKEAPKPE